MNASFARSYMAVVVWVFHLVLLPPWPMLLDAVQTDGAEQQDQDAKICSLFEYAYSNAKAWQTGDVLIVQEQVYDGINTGGKLNAEGILVATKIFRRIIFDFHARRVLIVSLKKAEILDLAKVTSIDDGRILASELDVQFVDLKNPEAIIRKIPGVSKSFLPGAVGSSEMSEFEFNSRFLDPRSIGIAGHFEFQLLDELRPGIERVSTGEKYIRSQIGKKSIDVTVLKQEMPDIRARFVTTHSFSVDTNMPEEFVAQIEFQSGEIRKQIEGSLEWQEFDGIFVPASFRQMSRRRYRSPAMSFMGDYTDEAVFQWISFNQPLNRELLDGAIVEDTERLKGLVNPELFEKRGLNPKETSR